jgi:signal transduction histidine kinase
MKNQYKISIELELTRARAYTDANKLRQALINIITNAIKYSKTGGVVFISCYTDSKMPGVVILVRDNGVGMNNAEIAQVGKPFYRVKKIDRPGSGLGMCVTKKIALLLNIGIGIKSQQNVGTEVKLTIKHIIG